jgi:D-serine deaminase-like pyridoxal phosphate-dependent protein
MVRFAEKLRAEGVGVPEVSVGSTPACCAAERYDGVTEIRPGNYAFFDAFQAAIGTCSHRDALAFTVLATVISHHAGRGELLVNAGALALSKDPGAVHVDPHCGFGTVCTLSGRPVPGLRLKALSQEHGEVAGADPGALGELPVGSRVRIVPNHSCLAAACFDRYHVAEEGEVVEEWRPARGW